MKLLRAIAPYLVATVLVALCLWAAYAFGVRVENKDRRTEVAELLREHEQTLAAIDQANRDALVAALQRQLDTEAKAAMDMAALDAKYTKEIQDEKARSDRDIAAVRAGEYRLRERFTCTGTSGPSSGAVQAGTSTGMGDAATKRGFGQEDAAAVIAAADEGDRWAKQLMACQDIVRRDRVQ